MHRVNTVEKMAEETRLILRIDPELKKAAQAKAKAQDLTLSQAVRRLLREWVKDDPSSSEEDSQESQ
jgi:predicted HicB family RNase H-like nuclease